MPKISALPLITTADAADELPINDVSVTTTKKITLTKLKEWLQSVAGWITTAMIGDSQITAGKLADSSMFLGITSVTGTISPSAGTETNVASTTVTVPTTTRKLRCTLTVPQVLTSVATDRFTLRLKEDGVLKQQYYTGAPSAGWSGTVTKTITAPAAGSHVYLWTIQRDTGTGFLTLYGAATSVIEQVVELV